MPQLIGENIFIHPLLRLPDDIIIGTNSVIGQEDPDCDPEINIGNSVRIGTFCVLEDKITIGSNVNIDHYCAIYEGARIANNAKILYGAKIHKNAWIGEDAIIGSQIPERMIIHDRVTFMGAVAHSYRDASLNWDDTDESSPEVGEGSVVGLNSLLIGDVKIGKGCYVAAGETLRHDLPDHSVFYKGAVYHISEFKGLIKTRL